jgi:hypothetical protein
MPRVRRLALASRLVHWRTKELPGRGRGLRPPSLVARHRQIGTVARLADANVISNQAALDLKLALAAEAEPAWASIRTELQERGGFLLIEIQLAASPLPGLTPGHAAARSVIESWLPDDLGGSPQWAVVFTFDGRVVDRIVPGDL